MTHKPGLYVVATPIGNLGDMTFRAVETLRAADLILCEDTRQTAKLCQAYDITTPRQPYHDHNGPRVRPAILTRLVEGNMICLVSDAGTPLISDPGYKLVHEARAQDIMVTAVPGPSAAVTALSIAGLPSDQFFFAGFVPAKNASREKFLKSLKAVPGTLVFYESAARLGDTIYAIKTLLGNRDVVIARELTKLHEEIIHGTCEHLIKAFSNRAPLKGEIVLLVQAAEPATVNPEDLDKFLLNALETTSVKQAASAAAGQFSVSRTMAYQRALALNKLADKAPSS